jgi:hypothetical protein
MNAVEFYTRMTGYFGKYDEKTDAELVRAVRAELSRIADDSYEDLYGALLRTRPRAFGPPDVAAIAAAAAALRSAGLIIDRPSIPQPCPVCGSIPAGAICRMCGLDLADRHDLAAVRERADLYRSGKPCLVDIRGEFAKMIARRSIGSEVRR